MLGRVRIPGLDVLIVSYEKVDDKIISCTSIESNNKFSAYAEHLLLEDDHIPDFTGAYRFLSNFCAVGVIYEEVKYPSVEHAYVAAKTTNLKHREIIRTLSTAGKAKQYGRELKLREDFGSIKVEVMINLVTQKFLQEPFRSLLLATGSSELVERNNHFDTYWGVYNGEGNNLLGKILMQVRKSLIEQSLQVTP